MPADLEFDYIEATAAMDKFSQDEIDELKSWSEKLDKTKYVPKDLTNKQLLLFYNACYGDMEKTKMCIEKYFWCRKNAPEFFENRILSMEDMKKSMEILEFSFLPAKSVEGYDIIFHRLHDTDPGKYNLETGIKLLFMTVDACLNKRGPQPGYIFLFDMRGVKFGHLTKVSLSKSVSIAENSESKSAPSFMTLGNELQQIAPQSDNGSLRKFFQYVQEAMPVRMKAIHVMNTEPVLDKLMLLIKPFMDKKFFDMLKFHNKNEDLEKFYSTVISRSSLPPDFGGTLADTQTLHKKCMQQLALFEPYFKAEEEQRIAALPDKKREKAMERAFKNLDID